MIPVIEAEQCSKRQSHTWPIPPEAPRTAGVLHQPSDICNRSRVFTCFNHDEFPRSRRSVVWLTPKKVLFRVAGKVYGLGKRCAGDFLKFPGRV